MFDFGWGCYISERNVVINCGGKVYMLDTTTSLNTLSLIGVNEDIFGEGNVAL